MKTSALLLVIIILILFTLISCDTGQRENSEPVRQETPEALQDDKIEFKSYSGRGDLTEELYQELVDQTPALKKLEEDIDVFRLKPNDLIEKFNAYDTKSNSYYGSANDKATAITDSILRAKILALINKSNSQYSAKTAEMNALLKTISQNGTTLNDHLSVLKIVLTLPVIEQYQDKNMPDKKGFENLIKEQKHLIMRTDSLISVQ